MTGSVKLSVTAAAGDSLSVTVTLNVPDALGVPESNPVELSVSPAGRVDPVAVDH
jgi:hypothetical protein